MNRKLYRAYREAALTSYEQIEPRVTPDELLITEELNSEFLVRCEQHFGAHGFDHLLANKALLNLRKSGTLGPTGRRSMKMQCTGSLAVSWASLTGDRRSVAEMEGSPSGGEQ